MGNSSSNAFLSVNDAEKAFITAGSTISGEIRCSHDQSVSNDIFSNVTLYFIGKEDVEVCYTGSGHGTKSGGPKYKSSKKDIIRTIIPVNIDSTKSGCYPFQFRIPDQLPSSMFFKDGNGGHCSIRYKVKMHFNPLVSKSFSAARDQEIELHILAKPPGTTHPWLPDPTTTKMRSLFCIPRGSITWAVGVDETRVGVGEELVIKLGIKNESLAHFDVVAKLKQIVEWHTSGHRSTNESIICSLGFTKTDSMKPWSKQQLREKCRSTKGDTITPLDTHATEPLTAYEEVIDAIKVGNNQVRFPIPDCACQSYTGRIMRIQHYVKIEAQTSSHHNSPKLVIPIEIVSPREPTPIVTAQVIPAVTPSAPPIWDDDTSFDASYSYKANTFVVAATVDEGEHGQDQVIYDSKPSECSI